MPAAAAWLVMGGPEMNYDLVKQINQTANCFWAENGCRGSYIDWTSRYLNAIGAGMRSGGGRISCGSKRTIIFQMEWRFSEKPSQNLIIYWVSQWCRSKKYEPSCVIRHDLAFGKFLEPKFPSFPVEEIETKYFRELILYLIEFYSSNGFTYIPSRDLKLLFVPDLAVWKFGRLELLFLWVCAMGG